MQTWLLSLLSIGLGGSAAAVAALALRPWLMRRYTARWRCRLWGVLAAVLLAGPVLLALPLPQLPAAPGWRVTLPAPETAPTDRVSAAQNGEFSTKESDPVENPARPETDTSAVTENQPIDETVPQAGNTTPKAEFPVKLPQLPKPSLPAAVFALWLAGALGFALWRAAGYWLWSRRVRRWDSPAPAYAVRIARWAAKEQGLTRRVPVRCNARISGPLVTGLVRPTLLLPETLPPEEELAMICLHEMAHCRRGDLWYMLLLEAARAVHWYSPTVHFLVRAARQDIEMACDESAAANKPAAWRRQYCEALLHALECPAGPVLTTRFGVGKSQITARLRQIMKPGRMRRGLLAFCAAALAVALCCCAVRLEPASTSQANTEDEAPIWVDITQPEGGQLDLAAITGQENGLPELARPGTEMTDEEILALAEELIQREQIWRNWLLDIARHTLDYENSITWSNETGTYVNYRLLDVTGAAQLRAVLECVYTQAYAEKQLEGVIAQSGQPEERIYRGMLIEKDGNLYASDQEEYTGGLYGGGELVGAQIMGVTENAISLQANWRLPDDPSVRYNGVLTLRRERGRWVQDGWWDNSYIQLPEKLAQQAADDFDLGTRLRYAWALGQGLKDGDQTRVDWAFSGMLEPPRKYNWEDAYSLADITGLQVKDFDVDVTEEGQIYLWLDVADPGNTPLRQGEDWYELNFSSSHIGDAQNTVYGMYPQRDKFGVATRYPEPDPKGDQESVDKITDVVRVFYTWALWASPSELPTEWQPVEPYLNETTFYLGMRMRQEGRTDAEGRFTLEQLTEAGREYLDDPDYTPDPVSLAECCHPADENGLYRLLEIGVETDPAVIRYLGADFAAGTAYAVLRYYKDEVGLIPDFDVAFSLYRSQDGTGGWKVDQVRRIPGGAGLTGIF